MSLSEEKRVLLSQLVDGELPPDQANKLLSEVFGELADVLGNVEAAKELHAMLELHQTLRLWREQSPQRAVVATVLPHHGADMSHFRQLATMAAAAALGGILVAGGFYLAGQSNAIPTVAPAPQQTVVLVSPEQRSEIANAFALHESVAGPLSWYASDESTIQVAPAGRDETLREPIAVVLRLKPDAATLMAESIPPKTYVIVCRNNDSATIELPQSILAQKVRLRLLTKTVNGDVRLQYTIAADGTNNRMDEGVLAGCRSVAFNQTSLGQLAVNNRLLDVDASAWVLKN